MSFRPFGASILLLVGVAAGAQPPAPPAGTIAGIVVDGGNNNSAIRRAVVTLSTAEAQPRDAVAWTDANGRFAFGYLPAGRYELRASKFGFQAIAYGADSPRRPPGTIQLSAGEARTDIVFHLERMTTITGSVLDEQGDPISNISVTAMRWGWQRRKRKLLPGPSAPTDGAGRYRLTGLAPGRYAIVAAAFGSRQAVQIHPESAPGQPQMPRSLGLQYYPGTDRAESATVLSIEAGHEYSQIDFHLAARSNPVVHGKIAAPPGAGKLEQVSVMAFSEDANGMSSGLGVSQPDMVFQSDQLQPGAYTFVAQATVEGRRYRGLQPVEVADGMPDLTIALQASIDLAGTVTVEGPDAAKHAASFVSLVAGDGGVQFNQVNGQPLRATVNKDGSFKIDNVPPGIWDINAGPVAPGGYIKSMRLGDQDVLTEDMVIQSSTQALLKIVIGTQAASLQGEVTGDAQSARAVVLLAPEPRFQHVLSFYRMAAADANGHFEIKNAMPGNYQL